MLPSHAADGHSVWNIEINAKHLNKQTEKPADGSWTNGVGRALQRRNTSDQQVLKCSAF